MDIDKENRTTASSQSSTKKTTAGYQIPWIEKYRPQTLDDVVGNEETVLRLQAIAVDGNLPNLILSGPPGTGKVGLVLTAGYPCTGTVQYCTVQPLTVLPLRFLFYRRHPFTHWLVSS